MNTKPLLTTALITSLLAATSANAGGRLDEFKFTGVEIAPGIEQVDIVPIFWDKRCAKVEYTLDTILPNAGTPDEIDIETTRAELQASFDQWNQIPTSYIEMNITQVRTIGNGTRGFDFINELTFEVPDDFTALASSPSISLQEDTEFLVGDDIDGDGDSDVFDPEVAGINECHDFDEDGDIEFPAGTYLAGTILDNDVQFTTSLPWSAEPNANPVADIQAVATHEFGHSHGLAHTPLNQISDEDGTGSTMFPSIDITDTAAQFGSRTLHADDIAWSSFVYPEGSDRRGIAGLQGSDRPFSRLYSVIRGEVTRNGTGVLGASVSATRAGRNEAVIADAITGTAIVIFDTATGDILLAPEEIGVVDGRYELPVPRGFYRLGLQALDGSPAGSNQVSLVGVVGNLYGQQNFSEEGLSYGRREGALETDPGRSRFIVAFPHRSPRNVDFVVNEDVAFQAYGDLDFAGTGAVIGVTGVTYATRFANADVLAQLDAGAILTTTTVNTNVFDSSVVPAFKRLALVTGTVSEDGTVADINTEFAFRQSNGQFIGQESDDTPFFLRGARGLSWFLKYKLRRYPEKDLFVIVEAEDDFVTGDSGVPPLIGVDDEGPFGDSFLSVENGEFAAVPLNFGIRLLFTPASLEQEPEDPVTVN